MPIHSVHPNISLRAQPKLEISLNNNSLTSLRPGETLSVTIIEKISQNQYYIDIKDKIIAASSEVSLNPGEKLQVKVQGIHPQIILNLDNADKQRTVAKIHEAFLHWRMNPDALIDIQSKISEFSKNIKFGGLQLSFSDKEIDVLLEQFQKIIFSSKTLQNKMFIKEFVNRMGLMLESNLEKIASGYLKDDKFFNITDNLKSLLLKLSAAINDAQQSITTKHDAQAVARLTNMASFASEALQVIEARQAVNIQYQQNEAGLYLQIPLKTGESFRQADIFIEPDNKKTTASRKNSSVSVAIFLDLDFLGDIAINAFLTQGSIRVMIQCESDVIRDLVCASLDLLKNALNQVGYHIERMECIKAFDLKQRRTIFIEQKILETTDLVNQFA